jgi:hypothetical protein
LYLDGTLAGLSACFQSALGEINLLATSFAGMLFFKLI